MSASARASATVFTAALGLLAAPPAFAASEAISIVSQEIPPVSQQMPSDSDPGEQAFRLHSDRIGRDFEVVVHHPAARAVLPGQKLPVIYALDGGLGVAGQIGVLLGATGAMEPTYMVDIGYPAGEAGTRRVEDLRHVKVTQGSVTGGGGGAVFEAFLLEDLRPFIEAKFPVDPSRAVLVGHSLGGLFTAHVFADKPDAFPFVLPPVRSISFRDQPLSDEAVKHYVGVYGLPDGSTLTVSMPKGQSGAPTSLQVQVAGQRPTTFLENGKDRFYARSADLDATFDGAGLTLVAGGVKLRAEKMKAAPEHGAAR